MIVDRERCVGSGECVFTVPDIFDQDEADGIVLLLTDTPEEALWGRRAPGRPPMPRQGHSGGGGVVYFGEAALCAAPQPFRRQAAARASYTLSQLCHAGA